MAKYIEEQKMLLDDFCVWKQMTEEEQTAFERLSTEEEVDRFKRTMLNKYL